MELLTVPDFITVEVTVQDAGGSSNTVSLALKYLDKQAKKKLLKRLALATFKQQKTILACNIISVSKILLSDNSLTDTYEKGIIYRLLDCAPYFFNFSSVFNSYLSSELEVDHLRKENLYLLGIWQGQQDTKGSAKAKEKELADEFSDIANFGTTEEPTASEKPPVIWESNAKLFKMFNVCRKWTNEHGLIPVLGIIEVAKEMNISVTTALDLIPYIHSGYLSIKN